MGKTRRFNVEYCQERIKKSKNKNNKIEKIRHPLYNGSPHVSESKTVLDSIFHVVDSGCQVLDSSLLSVETGFWIPVMRFRIP